MNKDQREIQRKLRILRHADETGVRPVLRSHLGGIIPGKQSIDPALFVAVDDGGERAGHVGLRINSIEFAGFDERGDGRPVFGSGIVACEERVLAAEGNRPFILPMSGKN